MGFWLAHYLMSRSLVQVPNPGSPLALSLLRNILHELLGYRLPLPHVPKFFGYAFGFSRNRRQRSELTSSIQRRASCSFTSTQYRLLGSGPVYRTFQSRFRSTSSSLS